MAEGPFWRRPQKTQNLQVEVQAYGLCAPGRTRTCDLRLRRATL